MSKVSIPAPAKITKRQHISIKELSQQVAHCTVTFSIAFNMPHFIKSHFITQQSWILLNVTLLIFIFMQTNGSDDCAFLFALGLMCIWIFDIKGFLFSLFCSLWLDVYLMRIFFLLWKNCWLIMYCLVARNLNVML